MNEKEIQQLLKISRDFEQFDRDCELGSVTRGDSSSNLLTSLAVARAKSAARMRWASVAIAACIVIAAIAKMQSATPPIVAPVAEIIVAETPEHSTGVQLVQATPVVPDVQLVIALYRNDSSPSERCPECWCVAQWSANWGEGRSINELQDHELVDDSMMHSCVTDPKRIVVLGLSGPASSMPKTEQQALDMSLCLMGLQENASPQAIAANPNCTPSGLEYCMTTWGK